MCRPYWNLVYLILVSRHGKKQIFCVTKWQFVSVVVGILLLQFNLFTYSLLYIIECLSKLAQPKYLLIPWSKKSRVLRFSQLWLGSNNRQVDRLIVWVNSMVLRPSQLWQVDSKTVGVSQVDSQTVGVSLVDSLTLVMNVFYNEFEELVLVKCMEN